MLPLIPLRLALGVPCHYLSPPLSWTCILTTVCHPSCRCFVQVEEPELEAGEEDGEDDRENWRLSREEEEELDYDEEDSDEEEELLDELLASKAPA